MSPLSVSDHRTLVDCKVKLAFLQKLQGFMGSIKATLEMLSSPTEPLTGTKSRQFLPHWGDSRRGNSTVETVPRPERVWLRVKEPKDHSDGMEGFSETPKFLTKKEMGNILINLTTMKRMKETNQVK